MSLAFQSLGAGPPLVLLHGLFGSGDNLRGLARGLADSYTVYLPDLPNHGRSPHGASATQESMADAVEEFTLGLSLARPVLSGHSIGAKVAMLMALRGTVDASALVSIDMAPRRYDPSHERILAAMQQLPLDEIGSRADADRFMADAVPNAAVRSFLLKNLERTGDRYGWRLNIGAIAADYERLLGWEAPGGVFGGPALFAGGARSTYLQEDRDAGQIRRWFPHAEIAIIPDAGHWLHADRPKELLRVVRGFLRRPITP